MTAVLALHTSAGRSFAAVRELRYDLISEHDDTRGPSQPYHRRRPGGPANPQPYACVRRPFADDRNGWPARQARLAVL
jgi:hypothetical protein